MLVVALPAAYYTARHKFPGRAAFLLLVLITQMLQPTVLATGLFREFLALRPQRHLAGDDPGQRGVQPVVRAVDDALASSPRVPKEIEEAAALDGAGKLRTLRTVTLPLVWPGIVTAMIFTFVACWNEFAASLVILTTAENQPLSVALTKFVGQYSTSWQYVFGVSVVGIVPVVILFAIIERRLVAGLTAGGVK